VRTDPDLRRDLRAFNDRIADIDQRLIRLEPAAP
jgi:hypothetical protein